MIERIIETHHRHGVLDGGEGGRRRSADLGGWRVVGDQLGILGFERLQFTNEHVVFDVRDLRSILLVVALIVVGNQTSESLRPLGRVGCGSTHLSERSHRVRQRAERRADC